MSDYPPRVGKSERIYQLWESGEGDMGELAIGLYDLTAHYKALWDDYAKLEAENERLGTTIDSQQGWHSKLKAEIERLRATLWWVQTAPPLRVEKIPIDVVEKYRQYQEYSAGIYHD